MNQNLYFLVINFNDCILYDFFRYLKVHRSRTHLKKLNHFCSHCGKGFFEKLRRDEHEYVKSLLHHAFITYVN